MSPKIDLRNLSFILLLAATTATHAQTSTDACGPPPLFGTSGPEICIAITQTGPAITPIYFRVPVPAPGLAPPTITGVSAGEYTVDTMTFVYLSGPTGMAMGMTGMVTRATPGNATLVITALGGWGPPISAGSGTVSLIGAASGTSRTQAGAAVWSAVGTVPAQDVKPWAFPRSADQSTTGAGSFNQVLPPQPIPASVDDTVAVSLIVPIHSNTVGTFTTIPAGIGVAPDGMPPPTLDFATAGGRPHFECYDVKVHRPSKEIRDVKLADQFDEVKERVGRITRLCTPVDKNGEGIPDPDLHLVCYKILDGHDPEVAVETRNQFGKATMDVRDARELCVPSKKKHLEEKQKEEKEP